MVLQPARLQICYPLWPVFHSIFAVYHQAKAYWLQVEYHMQQLAEHWVEG